MSDIVLRWEIDTASADFVAGKVESGVFTKGGFEWTIGMNRNDNYYTDFTLRCGVDHNLPWKNEVEVGMYLLDAYGGNPLDFSSARVKFNEDSLVWMDQTDIQLCWDDLTDHKFMTAGKATIEFRIKIISSETFQPTDPSKFSAPNHLSNVILKIGENKLHVYKELLAFHSPFFNTLFSGNFKEKGKEEVEIKDVVYEEFVDLLNLIYPDAVEITNRTVLHILKLADQFEMKGVMGQAEKFLIRSTGFKNRLRIADQHRLTKLRDHCLNSFVNSQELLNMCKSPESDNFSAELKMAIYERMRKL